MKTEKPVSPVKKTKNKKPAKDKPAVKYKKPASAVKTTTDALPPQLFTVPPKEALAFLNDFDSVIQNIRPLNARQFKELPVAVRELSHQLTDERGKRRMGYMNAAESLSAYARYFLPWNLFRLTRLFSAANPETFAFLEDGSVLLDLGSGPLTVPLALWLSRPELRAKKLVFYCTDISQAALSLGEELLLSAAARTTASSFPQEEWKIVRVKGPFGTEIRQKAAFVFCVNVCNELFWDSPQSLEDQAKKIASALLSYAAQNARFFVAEPGIPRSARFISLLRSEFLLLGLCVESPCPHEGRCPMDGRRGGKWCHFVLDAVNAPKKLRALSDEAGLPKERAAISFILAASGEFGQSKMPLIEKATLLKDPFLLRVISDSIKLPFGFGRYACSASGLVLAAGKASRFPSGTLVQTRVSLSDAKNLPKDKKSGAVLINM